MRKTFFSLLCLLVASCAWSVPQDKRGGATEVQVAGDYAYIVDIYGLKILDVRDPLQPSPAGSYDTPGEASGVAVDFLLSDAALTIYRVKASGELVYTGSFDLLSLIRP